MQSLELTPMERASGFVAGAQSGLPMLPAPDGRTARDALEAAVLGPLSSGSCFVSFSGGRDSSAVLATAMLVARREGVPPPIPVTLRFPDVRSTDESAWQELVIAHLAVPDWERIEVGEELDFLGGTAQACLRTHGLLWPPNAYFHVPMFRVATGGCLLTGLDGDGLFGGWRWARAQSVLARRVRPRRADPARIGLALAPPVVRRRWPRRFGPPPVAWLRAPAQQALARQWVSDAAAEPRRWDRRTAWYARRRYLALGLQSLAVIAAGEGADVRHPLAEPAFIAAVARDGGARGWGDRTATMAALFGDVLPPALIERRGKAEFGRALWRTEARTFARQWDGTGVDPAMVDAERLRAAWAADNPVFGSVTPLHVAWLAVSGRTSP